MASTAPFTGNELVYVSGTDGAGRPSSGQFPMSTSQFAMSNLPGQYQTNAATSGTTLTAANIAGANTASDPLVVYLNMTGTLAGAANAQLPTVAAMVAVFPTPVIGQTYILRVLNTSSGNFAWTVTTNTGWTLNGPSYAIAQNTWCEFLITLTSLTAATMQTIGRGVAP